MTFDLDDYFAERRANVGLMKADLTRISLDEVFELVQNLQKEKAYLQAILRHQHNYNKPFPVLEKPEDLLGGV